MRHPAPVAATMLKLIFGTFIWRARYRRSQSGLLTEVGKHRIMGGLLLLVAWSLSASIAIASWPRHTIDNSSLGADGARSMDVDRDGLPDIVAGWEQGGVSRIYLMGQRANQKPFWTIVEAGPAPSVEDALLVDLDQDSAVDVVSSTEGENKKVLIHWAPEDPRDYDNSAKWTTETLYDDGSQWMFAIAMDIDGKHGPDIVVGGKGPGAKIGWLQSPPDPRKVSDWKFHFLSSAGWIMSLLAKDMDADGDSDILLSDRKSRQAGIRWLENPGRDSTALATPWNLHWVADHLADPQLIDTTDFDDDGIEEIVVPYFVDDVGYISIFQTFDRTQWIEHRVSYPPHLGRAKALSAADVNLDGRADLVLSTEQAHEGKSGVVWLEYAESWDDPEWVVHDVSGPEGVKFDLNLLLDLDADGDLDIVNTEENDNARDGKPGLGLVWYENPVR